MALPALNAETTKATRKQLLRWSAWYFCANTALVLLIAMRYFFSIKLPTEIVALAFSVIAIIGHFASLTFLCFLILLPFIYLLPYRPVVLGLANLFAVTLILLITLDTFVFAQYHFHFNSMVVNLLFGGAANEIFVFSTKQWTLALTGLGLIIIIEIVLSLIIWRWSSDGNKRRHGAWVAITLSSIFIGQNVAYAWADAKAYTPITKQIRYFPGYKPLTAKRFFIRNGWATPNSNPQFKKAQSKSGLNYPQAPLNCTASKPQYNVLIIAIDSWRADSLTPEITPNTYHLVKNAWVFDNHFSGANSTRVGIFTLFYGIPGTYWHSMLAENQGAVLINQLVKQNFQMGIFASASLTSPEFNRTVFADIKNLRVRSIGKTPHDRDRDITEDFKTFIDSATEDDRPIFGFLFYDTPHAYDFPRDYPLQFQPSWDHVNFLKLDRNFNPEPFVNRYKNAVHYADSLVGEVLTKLESAGLVNNTVIIVTSDHGQEFNDSGQNYWGHNSNYSKYQVKVPLLVKWPNQPAKQFSHLTSHFDIAPTLLENLLGCNNPYSDYSNGKHLLDTKQPPYLIISNYNSYAVMENLHTTVVDEFGQIDLYDNKNYQRLEGKKVSPKVILSVMDDMATFYKH